MRRGLAQRKGGFERRKEDNSTVELLAELGKTVTPTKVGVQKLLRNLDSGFHRNDEKGFLQEAQWKAGRQINRPSVVRRCNAVNREQVIQKLQADSALREKFSVRSLAVFGSVVRGEAGPESDVDILVTFEPDARIGFFSFARLQRHLSELLQMPVDLVTPDALHKATRNRILEEAVHAI